MRKVTYRLLLMVIVIGMLTSCQKENHLTNEDDSSNINSSSLMMKAKAFFNGTITNQSFPIRGPRTERHGLKKTPLWTSANVRPGINGDVVIVPLEYEKNITFNYNSEGSKRSLENASILLISPDTKGSFKAEVVTYFPKDTLIDFNKKFEGTIFVEDWGGNRIDRYLIDNGRKYRFKQSSSGPSSEEYPAGCYAIVWYICDLVEGQAVNCQYLSTEYSPACNEGLEEPGEGGWFEEYEIEYYIKADHWWEVQAIPFNLGGGHVMNQIKMFGKHNTVDPTKIRFVNGSYFPGIRQVWNSNWPTWSNFSWTVGAEMLSIWGTNNQNMTAVSNGIVGFPNATSFNYNAQNSFHAQYGTIAWTPW